MATRSQYNISIIEAVDALSSIADLEFDRDTGIVQKHEVVLEDEKIDYKTVHWLHERDAPSTMHLVKEIFRVILHYLKQFYKKEYGYLTDPRTVEGIKTIMVLVGEAAKKLDKYTILFKEAKSKSVTQFKEYRQLQDFYLSKIDRKIDEGILSKWILGLSLGWQKETNIALTGTKTESEAFTEVRHVFVDLETVKKDSEYELFFIRKDDGSRFFSPRLLRNIKLVCDFGSYFGSRPEIDPLESIKIWHDRILHACGRNMIRSLGPQMQQFYHDMCKHRGNELIIIVNKAMMALLLSSHAHNLLRHNPNKTCGEYFEDFQYFLREAMHNREYQRWLAYPPEKNHFGNDVMDMIHLLDRGVFVTLQGMQEMIPVISGLVKQASQTQSKEHLDEITVSKSLWSRMTSDYAAMTKLLKHHPNGPLIKVLDILEEHSYHVFDPLMQHNVPNQLYDISFNEKRINLIRMPAPILQEVINKAAIDEEFKGFLRANNKRGFKHLLFNLQDKTSWRECARSSAVEDLQNQDEFKKSLAVVTLATDTDFYHQLAPYNQNNHAVNFMDQFKEHILGEDTGFYFPEAIDRKALSKFIDKTFETIHRIFFSSKNVLVRESRTDFIEIFYLLLQLKIVEWLNPDSFSFTCKDGIDIGESYGAGLFAFLKLINHREWTESDWEYFNFMLYGPALIIRERIMLPEKFNRMASAIRAIENAQREFGVNNFADIIKEGFLEYKSPVLSAELLYPKSA